MASRDDGVRSLKWRGAALPATLLAILILATFLRFYGLGRESLWNDEMSSWARGNFATLSQVFDIGIRGDSHPPGYVVMLYFIQKCFGRSEVVLRFPSAVAGVLAVLMMFLLGRRLYSYREGLIAAALMAVLWAPVYYSQEARDYALLILFSLLTTYFWLGFVPVLGATPSDDRRGLSVAAYTGVAIAAAYVHYYGLLLVVLQGLAALYYALRRAPIRRPLLLPVLAAYATVAVTYLPWLAVMRQQVGIQVNNPLPRPEWRIFPEYFLHLFNGSQIVAGLILAVYVLGLVGTLARWHVGMFERSPSGLLLVLWVVLPLLVVFVESRLFLPIMQLRYLVIILPPAYLLLARAITALPEAAPLPARPLCQAAYAVGLVGLLLYHLVVATHYYTVPRKEQFREAVNYVVQHDAAYGDSLIVGVVWNLDYLNYYFERSGSARRVDLEAAEAGDIPALAAALAGQNPRDVWFIQVHRNPDEAFMAYLNDNLRLVEEQHFSGATVWRFER